MHQHEYHYFDLCSVCCIYYTTVCLQCCSVCPYLVHPKVGQSGLTDHIITLANVIMHSYRSLQLFLYKCVLTIII